MVKRLKLIILFLMSFLFVVGAAVLLMPTINNVVKADNEEVPEVEECEHNFVYLYNESAVDCLHQRPENGRCFYCTICGKTYEALTGYGLFNELNSEDPDNNLFYVQDFSYNYVSDGWQNMNDTPTGSNISISYDAESRILELNGYVGQNMLIVVPSRYLNYVSEVGESYALLAEYVGGNLYNSPLSAETESGHSSFAIMMMPGLIDMETLAYLAGYESPTMYSSDGTPIYSMYSELNTFSRYKRESNIPHLEIQFGWCDNTRELLTYYSGDGSWSSNYYCYSFCSEITAKMGYCGIQLIRGDRFQGNYQIKLDLVKLDDNTYNSYHTDINNYFNEEHGVHDNFFIMQDRQVSNSPYDYAMYYGSESEISLVNGDHNYEWVDEVLPTCTSIGVQGHYHCTRCGQNADENYDEISELETYAALGHDFGEWTVTVAPTCNSYGEKERYCSRGCAETSTIDRLNHDYGEWTETVAPTCKRTGLEERVCSLCGGKDTRYTSWLGHEFGEWIEEVPALCSTAGIKGHYSCTRCGENADENYIEISDLAIAALGHDFGEWIEEVPATTLSTGVRGHYHCSRCGKNFDRYYNEIPNGNLSLDVIQVQSSEPSGDSDEPGEEISSWVQNNLGITVSGTACIIIIGIAVYFIIFRRRR